MSFKNIIFPIHGGVASVYGAIISSFPSDRVQLVRTSHGSAVNATVQSTYLQGEKERQFVGLPERNVTQRQYKRA